jgi:hypothetical protein
MKLSAASSISFMNPTITAVAAEIRVGHDGIKYWIQTAGMRSDLQRCLENP